MAKVTSKKNIQHTSILEAFVKENMFKVLGINFNIGRLLTPWEFPESLPYALEPAPREQHSIRVLLENSSTFSNLFSISFFNIKQPMHLKLLQWVLFVNTLLTLTLTMKPPR